MKISKVSIDKIAQLITTGLVDKKLVKLKTQRENLKNRIESAIMQELKKEEDLDKEVSELMEKNKNVIGKDDIDHQKMFNLIKTKLAKEKGIVL